MLNNSNDSLANIVDRKTIWQYTDDDFEQVKRMKLAEFSKNFIKNS